MGRRGTAYRGSPGPRGGAGRDARPGDSDRLLAHARLLGRGGDPGFGAAVRLLTPIVDGGLPPLPALLDERLEERARVEPLTPAERRVLELLPTQLSFPEMAARLFVGRPTVKTHVQHIHGRLGVSTRTEAVERARGSGLLPPR